MEITLRDEASGLFGRADRIEREGNATRIVDLKTGLRQDAATPEQRRQLLLYAVLAHRTNGEWPRSIAVEDASGAQYVTPLDPVEAESALEEVLSAVAAFNARVQSPAAFVATAEPSSERCRWCAFRVVCGPYWASLTTDWGHRTTFGKVVESGQVGDGHFLGMAVESPIDQVGQRVHVSHLATEVPNDATKAVVVDWAGNAGESDVRGRWTTVMRTW